MKNKIKKISKGNFQVERPDIELLETNITMVIGEGEVCKGSFTLRNRLEGNIRGLVYPSSFRVHLNEQGFEGNPVKVEFTYDGTGMLPGEVEKSKFTVVCNGGEYEIAFTAIVEKPYIMTNYGKVQTIEDFKKLAIQDFNTARKLFKSRDFYEVIKYEKPRIVALYDNMRKWSLSEEALEEFLVGIKQKECLFLMMSAEETVLENVEEETKEVLTLTKNTWGYMPITVESKGDFLQAGRRNFTTDEFVGSTFKLEYFIDPKKLHAGNNFGQILLHTPYETLYYDVLVKQPAEEHPNHGLEDIMKAGLFKSYLALICGKVDVNDWTENAEGKIKELRNCAPENEMYELMQAHVYLRGGRNEEARWILDNYNYNRFAIGKKPEINAYYLFLSALLKKDSAQTKKAVDEINKAYMKHPDSWQLLCMLINIDPVYRNYSERLHVLERQYFLGAHSMLFFAEAYICYQEKTNLLKKLGDFELRVLLFAIRHKMMTKELALYMANLASQQKNFDQRLFKILTGCYKMYPDTMILMAICTLLIKGQKTSNEYFVWYEKAVAEELKIAQLYEYYMLSIDPKKVRKALPRMILLYFMHGHSLDYKKAALLYANILTYEDETSNLFAQYRMNIEKFAWDQLEKRHITEELGVIYKRFCREMDMDVKRLRAMRDICHSYNVKTKVPNIKCVIVIEGDGSIRQRVPYTENGAQVYLYDKESRIVVETKDGRHYAGSIPVETQRLFYELRFIDMCKKRLESYENDKAREGKLELSFENIQKRGLASFDEKMVFGLCNKKIREENYEEDDFLSYLCFELFNRGYFNKITLSYLANYFCGATKDMKRIWYETREYGLQTNKLAERIITQMLFSEVVFGEEEIFCDYYESGAYFRLKQAYLAYIAREYVVKNRQVDKSIFDIILREQDEEEELADICKIAVLKYYSTNKPSEQSEEIVKAFLQEMCEKGLVFPCYLKYPENWLREVQLYDKVIVEYRAAKGSKVTLYYQYAKKDQEVIGYKEEALTPVYDNIYVKEFVLFHDEQLRYYFVEHQNGKSKAGEKMSCVQNRKMTNFGKYGRMDSMMGMSDENIEYEMKKIAAEEKLAEEIYQIY